MARDASITGLRKDYLTSLFGRRLGLDSGGALVGPYGIRLPADGWSSAGSSFPSTSLATLSIYGISVLGTTGSSGTSATTSGEVQQLPAPVPGVRKTLINVSSAMIAFGTTAAAAYMMTSASSTYQWCNLAGPGANVELIGISTSKWFVLGNVANSSFSTQVSLL